MNRSGKTPEAPHDAQRLTAHEIFEAVVQNGRDELRRPLAGIAFSAVAGGFTIGLSALATTLVTGAIGTTGYARLLVAAVYPIGFIAVVIGRAQFFTENTLFPVLAYLAVRRRLPRLLAFWAVVLAGNLLGVWGFALLAMHTQALAPATRLGLAAGGLHAVAATWAGVFWSAVIGGWLMALVAWMVSASQWTSGQILVTWFFTFLIALGEFAHCIATSAEIVAAVTAHQLPATAYLDWLLPAVLGNIAGGVVIVSLLNYGQVRAGEG